MASQQQTPDEGSSSAAARFSVPRVQVSSDTWGPSSLPDRYANMPFAPFSKGDRLGQVADFGDYLYGHQRSRWYGRHDTNAEIGYRHDMRSEQTFQLVDTTRVPKRRGPPRRQRLRKDAPVAGDRGWEDRAMPDLTRQQKKVLHHGTNVNKRRERLNRAKFDSRRRQPFGQQRVKREASVRITTEWNNLETFDLSQLSALQTGEPAVEDLRWCGQLAKYVDKYDRVTTRTKARLNRYEDYDFYYVSAREDPVIQELSNEDAGNVFATDAVLAHLMTCGRSVYPWDVVITYLGGTIFFDVRDALDFEMHTVNETSRNPPPEGDEYDDDVNSRENLELEATAINQNYTQQVVDGEASRDEVGFKPEENPFWDSEEAERGHQPARMAYRYRKFQLGSGINLVARTTVNTVTLRTGEPKFATLFALTEHDPKVSNSTPWRTSIDSQRGAVIAQELQNNGFKLAKWTALTQLSGSHQMKIGFVSRVNSKSPDSHVLLGTQVFSPEAFAHQMSLSFHNMWGVLKWLVELVRTHAENLRDEATEPDEHVCKFVLVKDPNRPNVSLYSVPMETFEESDDEDESEEEESDEEEGE